MLKVKLAKPLSRIKNIIKPYRNKSSTSHKFATSAALLKPRKGYFDAKDVNIIDAFLIDEGIFFLYFSKCPCAIGAALFDKKNPETILWRSANPIYSDKTKFVPEKIQMVERKIFIHLVKGAKTKKIKISLNLLLHKFKEKTRIASSFLNSIVERSQNNPIIQPSTTHIWENCATFNAAALCLNGKIHFIYRAIGDGGMSVLGYANSKDGIHIDERLSAPVYIPHEEFEFKQDKTCAVKFNYCSGGGGWGGCEDPRLTLIDDTIYMTYTAFNGTEPPGVALTSITVKDFLAKNWKWRKSTLISPRGQISKNWVLFPEKINGKYAILHSISPKIQMDFFDNLNFDHGKCITNSIHAQSPRNGCWDNQLRGVGPPPIKTNEGWLILYHAMDKNDPNKYKLGAMLLDYKKPNKILCRATHPVLEPTAYYEKHGCKGDVIYSCGAVVMDNKLFVYYGGADTVTCVATANFTDFITRLKNSCIPPEMIAENSVKVY